MKIIIGALLMICCIATSYSQSMLSFCTAVDPQSGYCVFDNTKFISSPDSTVARIYIKISNPKGFDSDTITFKIFSVGKEGEETFSHSLIQKIETGWDMCWQNEKFNSPGTYLIKVYNKEGLLICSRSFELIKFS
jgi:hypothetical protein